MLENILKKNVEITNLSNFKTKAYTKYYYEINSLEDLDLISSIYNFSKENDLGFLIIWWWTNLLFAFEEYNWVIVKNNLNWFTYNKNTKILEVNTNELISDISLNLEKNYNQDLWHRFIWLPGSIWWAIYWNAWCFWLEAENNLLNCKVLKLKTWQIIYLWKNDLKFSYRSSLFKEKKDYFIISWVFDLSKKVEKYHSDVDNLEFREKKQPKWNTCWSFFKNPSKDMTAWYLIEKVWFKWKSLWTAYFSDLHSNFLMSRDNWNYRDLLSLIDLVKKEVKLCFDIELKEEVIIIYN